MVQHNAQIRLNPADETIHVGAIQIRFLVTGAESNGSAVIFELTVPAGVKLPAPAHSHDAYEETLYGLLGITTWTVDGVPIEVGQGKRYASRGVRSMRSPTMGSWRRSRCPP